jgi:hypothetical protein
MRRRALELDAERFGENGVVAPSETLEISQALAVAQDQDEIWDTWPSLDIRA